MTLEQLTAQMIRHVRSGKGKLQVEVETPAGYPAVTSLEIVESTLGVTAVLLTG